MKIAHLVGRTALAALIGLPLGLSAAEDGAQGGAEKRCIPLSRISSVRVLDDQHIRFEMAGGPDYLNTLPRRCPGLNRNDPILYKTSLSELCDLDTITVLHQVGGGFMRGATCGLGTFVPVEEKPSGDEAAPAAD
ncbi:MAG: hypothetical protein KatS3mg124_1020 [Porticoccaceae bacterium]|nr:MAG: hypothetical protein KatS3mg124_1020 [Porticoccaceae bacterium]